MKAKGGRGSMTLIAVFVYFLFSVLGLGLIHISQIHSKLGRHKKNMALLEYAAENGIKQGYGNLAEQIASRDEPALLTEDQYSGLRQDAAAGGLRLAEEALGATFPLVIEETAGDQIWRSSVAFSLSPLPADGAFVFADFKGTIAAESRLRDIPFKKSASLDVSLDILAGCIPLAYFPFLIAGNMTSEERQNYRQSQSIELLGTEKSRGSRSISFSGASTLSRDADLLLKKDLNIRILTPGKLTRAELRSALGLEMVDEPVPEGVYLIHNDAGLGGIYAQGDLDEMILAIDAGFQVISFRRDGDIWSLKFNPAQNVTVFSSPVQIQTFDRAPLGIIMINGRIRSLGGGIINAAGAAELCKEEAIPCVLQGVSLTIVSADQVTLSSHLVHQGVKWLDGIPYLKDSTSQLIVYANGRDFLENTERSGRILIDPNGPGELKIQANLTATDALELPGRQRTMILAGGLQAGGLDMGESSLKVLPDERLLANTIVPQNSPLTNVPILWVHSLRPMQWNED